MGPELGGVSTVPTLRGFQSDWLDWPQVNTKWQFTAHGNDDTFNLLLVRRNLPRYLKCSAWPHISGCQRDTSYDLLKWLTQDLDEDRETFYVAFEICDVDYKVDSRSGCGTAID